MIDPITEADLDAFIDNQLEATRRIEVEEYLAGNPALAARMMEDMRLQHLLLLAFQNCDSSIPPALVNDAKRLERGLRWRRIGLRIRALAACVLLVGVGWLAHSHAGLFAVSGSHALPKHPAFVEDAQRSHETLLIRSHMASQRRTADFDPGEIMAVTGISLPSLPRGWRVTGTEIFPSSSGASVELALDAGELGIVSLFASRPDAIADALPPAATHGPNATTVYWQKGNLAFALTGSAPEADLKKAASHLRVIK